MAVTANTNETYDVTTIREDLSEAMASITNRDIAMSAIGSRNVDNTCWVGKLILLQLAQTDR